MKSNHRFTDAAVKSWSRTSPYENSAGWALLSKSSVLDQWWETCGPVDV